MIWGCMKLHKVELVIVDFEGYDLEDLLLEFRQSTDCIMHIINRDMVDYPREEWYDGHILNTHNPTRQQCLPFFD